MTDYDLTIFDDRLGQIRDGRKDLDIRVGMRKIRQIRPGDRIRFFSRRRSLLVNVTAVRRYSSFRGMIENEDCQRIAPEMSKGQLLFALQQLYPSQERFGVYVIEFEKER